MIYGVPMFLSIPHKHTPQLTILEAGYECKKHAIFIYIAKEQTEKPGAPIAGRDLDRDFDDEYALLVLHFETGDQARAALKALTGDYNPWNS